MRKTAYNKITILTSAESQGKKMQNTSDIIELFLKDLIERQNGELELKRNELAGHFNCAPSQINYVLATRFTVNRGYVVTSRKGGGGYIKITRINYTAKEQMLMHIINSIGGAIDEKSARAIIINLHQNELIEADKAKLLLAGINENCYKGLEPRLRQSVRAAILKQMLLACI